MKKYTRIAAAFCAAATAIAAMGMSACGEGNEDVFFIGGTGPLTGEAASYGLSVKNGADVAIAEINANGGLNGHLFKFKMVDDKATSTDAATGYSTLYNEGMQASIGSVTTDSCLAFGNAATADNMFFITPSASSSSVIAASNGYRVCFSDPDQGVFAYNIMKDYGKVGVIYQSDDTYSSGIYATYKENVDEDEDTELVAASYTKGNKTFSTQVQAMKSAGVEAIFLPMYYEDAFLIIKEAKAQSITVDFYGSDGLDGLFGFAEKSGETDMVKGVKYITPFDATSTDAVSAKFVAAYKEANNGETPDQFAADGYDAVMVIYEAMKAAGVTDVNISCSDLCDAITGVLQNGTFSYTGATGTMSWDEGGAPIKNAIVYEIK